jgi:effector-binding domain-containing protein
MQGASAGRSKWIGIGAGVIAGAAAIGAGLFLLNETRVEKPRYRVIESDGAIEIRDYPAMLVAATTATGTRERALGAGFRRLANYIFAKDRGGADRLAMTAPVLSDRPAGRAEKIAMTAPVLSDGGGQQWRTRFVMPSRYTRDTLPPTGPEVTIEEVPAHRVAAIRFSGIADDAALYAHERQLREWIADRGLTAGRVDYAFYNSPFMPAPFRRNEVLITIG